MWATHWSFTCSMAIVLILSLYADQDMPYVRGPYMFCTDVNMHKWRTSHDDCLQNEKHKLKFWLKVLDRTEQCICSVVVQFYPWFKFLAIKNCIRTFRKSILRNFKKVKNIRRLNVLGRHYQVKKKYSMDRRKKK